MTVHICRDLLTLPTASSPASNMYFLSLFLYHVLQYDVDLQTNFNLTSSTYLKGSSTGDEISFASVGTTNGTSSVTIPSSEYTLTLSDIDRIIALRSEDWPRHNSGLFRITSIDAGLNVAFIDYRSTDSPPTESSLRWKIFEKETSLTGWASGSNGKIAQYATAGSGSSASRITFNAPRGYHVRLALESIPDRSGTIPAGFSIAPGIGTVDGGDYDNESGHLHGPMWYNTTSSAYRGTAVGWSPSVNNFEWTTGQWRVYMWGNDETGTCLAFNRNVSFSTGGNGWAAFGIPEDEPDDATLGRLELIDRLFVVGHSQALPNLSWRTGYVSDGHMTGMAWSLYKKPVPCVLSSYSDITNQITHVRDSTLATGSSFGNFTELLDVDVLAGTMDSLSSPSAYPGLFNFEPRRIGRFPLARQGRSNFPAWTLGTMASGDDRETWLHTSGGIYLPWGGPILSGTVNSGSLTVYPYASSSIQNDSGFLFTESNPPGHDPQRDSVVYTETSLDGNRFRKTYSYYRQPTILVDVIKGGSNPSKP